MLKATETSLKIHFCEGAYFVYIYIYKLKVFKLILLYVISQGENY